MIRRPPRSTLSLHDALPISNDLPPEIWQLAVPDVGTTTTTGSCGYVKVRPPFVVTARDRKSTRLNSSHSQISYAVFCLKKKNIHILPLHPLAPNNPSPHSLC